MITMITTAQDQRKKKAEEKGNKEPRMILRPCGRSDKNVDFMG
jgi:hypothetical protein